MSARLHPDGRMGRAAFYLKIADPELILDVVGAYQRGLSYTAAARKCGVNEGIVRAIMKTHAPGSIRRPHRKKPGAIQRQEEILTLASLGQFACGVCRDCGVPIVSATSPQKGQRCGFCKARCWFGRAVA